jgi:hypothetical protein
MVMPSPVTYICHGLAATWPMLLAGHYRLQPFVPRAPALSIMKAAYDNDNLAGTFVYACCIR